MTQTIHTNVEIIEVKPYHEAKDSDVKMCSMPTRLDDKHSEFYRKFHTVHCDQKKSHDCSGRITVDRNGITLSCPLCGDARSVYTK